MGTTEIKQPKYKVGDYVSAVDNCGQEHNAIIKEVIRKNDIYLYRVNDHLFGENSIFTNDKDYQVSVMLHRRSASCVYNNAMNDIIGLCEEKSEVLLGDKNELVIEFGEVDAVKYIDWNDIKGVKFNKLKITKEVDEDITYISWFVYDETEDEKWVDVFENYWDNIYCSIDIILTRELKNLLNK